MSLDSTQQANSASGTTLLPCPFCGGEAELLPAELRETHDAMIECTNCETTGPTTATSAEAVELWNHRVDLPAGYSWVKDETHG